MATSASLTLRDLLYLYKTKNIGGVNNYQELLDLYNKIDSFIGSAEESDLSVDEKTMLGTITLERIRLQRNKQKNGK
jgi:hypothetical protein